MLWHKKRFTEHPHASKKKRKELTLSWEKNYNSFMKKDEVIKRLSKYCDIVSLENVEEIMKNVDRLLTSLSEKFYYSISEDIDKYVKMLNRIYLEKMVSLGKIKTLFLEDFGSSAN